MTTAAIMISRSCAMPIAVMMESSENTMSMTTIWTITQKNALALGAAVILFVTRFHLGVDFMGGLRDQEQSAADQDDVAPREGHALHGEDRLCQADQPHQQAEQENAEQKRERQPDLPRALGLRLRDARDDDRQKDHIVDAENDFQRRQGQQCCPGFGAGQQRDHALSDLRSRIAASLATI